VPRVTCELSKVLGFAGKFSGVSGGNVLWFGGNSAEGLCNFLRAKKLKLRTSLCMALRIDNVAVCYFILRHFLSAYIIQDDSEESSILWQVIVRK
jgi:hypothetical protein